MRHFVAFTFVCTANTFELFFAMFKDKNLNSNHCYEIQQDFQWKYMPQGSRMHGGKGGGYMESCAALQRHVAMLASSLCQYSDHK